MKILSREQIQEADAYTMAHEPIASINLMKRASTAFVQAFRQRFPHNRPVYVLAGNGNNGGDGLVISRLLADQGYLVSTYAVKGSSEPTADFQQNWERLPYHKLVALWEITEAGELPAFPSHAVVIDAMLGSGLNRPLKGLIYDLVKKLNEQNVTTVAVDIPTGVYCDELNPESVKVKATYTLTFQMPKLSFMLPEAYPFVGRFEPLPIGLSEAFIANAPTSYHFLESAEVAAHLKARTPFQHKGDFGHTLLMAGAYGTIGAVQLTGFAALRAGAGLLTIAAPQCGYTPLQTAVPEAMLKPDPEETHLTTTPDLASYQVIGIGPGIGQHADTEAMLEGLLDQVEQPLVMDADALNLLSQSPELWKKLPPNSLLTPHPGEFDRLTGKHATSLERLYTLQRLAAEQQVVIILKGGYTAIASPDGSVFFNSSGNPGMGTAGSGDTLTGILTSLLGQGYEPLTAAKLGVHWHGLAGDKAAEQLGQESLMARDIVGFLPQALQQLKAIKPVGHG
jgi:NAD(P)H-hydrate epimerase